MRIAVVSGPTITVPPNQYGGTEQVIYYLIKGLKEAGHEPILLGPGDSKIDCELIPIVDKALSFPTSKKDLKHFALLEARARKTTKKKLRQLLPTVDIIHSHGYDLYPFRNFPSVTTLHYMIKFEHIEYLKKRKDLFYTSISKSQQAVYPDLRHVATIYNAEDAEAFPVVTKPKDYLCFLGRFDRDKNPHEAIELALSLGMKIKLAGKLDYDGEDYFEEEIKKYLSHPLVEYLGELGFKDKVKLLSQAKCNLHPTNFREPFGLTVLEAAYCGTPTLAINKGAMPELIEPGRTGVLVEDFIEGRLHIEECFAMDRQYIANRAKQLFNYKTMAEQYVESYKKVIASMPVKHRTDTNVFSRTFQSLRTRIRRLYKVEA